MKVLILLSLVSGGLCFGFYDMPYVRDYHTALKQRSKINEEPMIPQEGPMSATIRMQSTQVAEITLMEQAKKGCFLRTVCAVGTVRDEEINRFSLAHGIVKFTDMLTEMSSETERQGLTARFPNLHKTLASFRVGADTKNLGLCDQLFPCKVSKAEELLEEAVAFHHEVNSDEMGATSTRIAYVGEEDEEEAGTGRTTCEATGNVCPAVSITCALCGVFLPGTCGDACVVGGLYCGFSGYACIIQAAKAEEATTPEPVTMPTVRAFESSAARNHRDFMQMMFGGHDM